MMRGHRGGNGLAGDMGRGVDRWGSDMKRREGEGRGLWEGNEEKWKWRLISMR